MQVKLNINEDSELRASIKDAIRGQVRSIVRDDVLAVLREVVSQKHKESIPSASYLERLVKEEVKAQVEAAVKRQLNGFNAHNAAREVAVSEVMKVFASFQRDK